MEKDNLYPSSVLLEWAKNNDVTVSRMMQNNESLSHIVGVLAREKEDYLKRIMELESIAPRKITMPDGKVMVWRCPDDLILEK